MRCNRESLPGIPSPGVEEVTPFGIVMDDPQPTHTCQNDYFGDEDFDEEEEDFGLTDDEYVHEDELALQSTTSTSCSSSSHQHNNTISSSEGVAHHSTITSASALTPTTASTNSNKKGKSKCCGGKTKKLFRCKNKSKNKELTSTVSPTLPSTSTSPCCDTVVNHVNPFTTIGLSEDQVCDMPFKCLKALMEEHKFSKEMTCQGKCYRRRLRNRRQVMAYAARKREKASKECKINSDLRQRVGSLCERKQQLEEDNTRKAEELTCLGSTCTQQQAENCFLMDKLKQLKAALGLKCPFTDK
eukprot:m.129877 g.129877  ORF g.129877 m.129877 type:complete len:300 (-) comp29439_c0_seq1:65-964(-)